MFLTDSAAYAFCVPANYVFDYSEENFIAGNFDQKM
jgi:hypothetical protein